MYSYANRFCDGIFGLGRYPLGGSILFIFGIILIAVVLYFVVRKSDSARNSESPLDLLQKRYVNGDISQEEYIEKKDILKGK